MCVLYGYGAGRGPGNGPPAPAETTILSGAIFLPTEFEMRVNEGALPLIMGNYASNFGINLYMFGTNAYTDGNNITIPRLDTSCDEEMEMAFGYVAHECGHIRYSDFAAAEKACAKSSALMSLFNALEDVRIEYLQIRNWPGLKRTFNFLVSSLQDNLCKYLRKSRNTAGLVTVFFNCSARAGCLGQDTAKGLRSARIRINRLLPKSLVAGLEKRAASVTACRNSDEVLKLSEEILDSIQSALESVRSAAGAGGGKEGSAGDPGLDAVIPGLFKKDARLPGPEESGGEGGRPAGEEAVFGNLLRALEKYGNNFSGKELRSLRKELFRVSGDGSYDTDLNRHSRADNIPTARTVIEKRSLSSKNAKDIGALNSRSSVPAKNLDLYRRVITDNSLRSVIGNLVRGYDRILAYHGESGKKVDCRKFMLSRGGRLGTDFFVRKKERRALNTSIHLLVDISGSMSRRCESDKSQTRAGVAKHAALSLAVALEGIRNVDSRVVYFPGCFCEYEEIYRTGQPLIERATYFDLNPRGSTPLAQSLMYSLNCMPHRDRYHRNVIIVITDGEPDNYQFAREMLERAENEGVEVYAVRISPDAGSRLNLFKNSYDIGDAGQLPDALIKLLGDRVFC